MTLDFDGIDESPAYYARLKRQIKRLDKVMAKLTKAKIPKADINFLIRYHQDVAIRTHKQVTRSRRHETQGN